MTKRNANISLASYDDIFSTQKERDGVGREQVQQIPIAELHPFEAHPFKVLDDEQMQRTVESVARFGVIVPLLARPDEYGGYEIVSGHRRCRAAQLVGLEELPVIVRDMTDDEAIIAMVDANLQRETILPSERAWAYRMKMDAIKHQGERTDLTSRQVGEKSWSVSQVSQGTEDSERQVHRFIRLTELLPELLDMVDEKRIAFNPAVELSYLSKEEQALFLEAMEYAQNTPSLSQAQRLKKLSQEGGATLEAMETIMNEAKKGELDQLTFKTESLRKYFPKSYTNRQMQDTIVKLLQQWQKKRQQEMSR